jgi:hypothetical protein
LLIQKSEHTKEKKMKKIITGLFLVFMLNNAFAQGNFEVGSNVLGLGIGIGNTYGNLGYGSQSPGIAVHYEHGMWEVGGPGVISLGGYIAYKSFSNDNSIYSTSWKYTVIGVRSAYHFNMINSTDWDVYGGAMIAMRILSVSDNDPYYSYGGSASDLYLSIFIGGRYYFSNNWAAFGEVGNGLATLTLGAAYKF